MPRFYLYKAVNKSGQPLHLAFETRAESFLEGSGGSYSVPGREYEVVSLVEIGQSRYMIEYRGYCTSFDSTGAHFYNDAMRAYLGLHQRWLDDMRLILEPQEEEV